MTAVEIESVKQNVIKKYGEKIGKAWAAWKEFIQRFPFREKPQAIDSLTPEDVYSPGSRESFLYYFEHKLKYLGPVNVPSDEPWRNARDSLDTFKKLLKVAVDDNRPLAAKIDAEWEKLRGWGGDKHFAKKLIFCYYPHDIVPIFKTEHLEHFVRCLGLSGGLDDRARDAFGRLYEDSSCGQKYELLNGLIMGFKNKSADFKDMDNVLFSRVLYEMYPPTEPISPPEKGVEPMSAARLLFSPVNEQGVMMLFAMHHRELGFPYILKVQQGYPDAVVIDKNGEVKRIEFELFASNFIVHGHDPNECDYIICWENDLAEGEGEYEALIKKVIALKEKLGYTEEG
jgi:hypothetical protein